MEPGAPSLGAMQNFWNTTPCNTTRTTLPVGSREFFDDIAEKRYRMEPHIRPFARFEEWKGKDVMEIGCGLGTDTMSFAKAGAIVTAVDYSTSSLALAQTNAQQLGLPVTFFHANAELLSQTVPTKPYDLIYSFGVLHHTPNPENAYKEVAKYMNNDSVFKLMVYHSMSLKTFLVMLQHGPLHWRQKIAYYSEAKEGSPITYTYTKSEITKLLDGCGLKVDSVEIHYLWMRWYLKWMPAPMLRFIDEHFGWNLCINASLK